MPIEVAFAQILLERRHALGLTQAQAAELCDLSERGYQKIERAQVVTRLDTAACIAHALGFGLDAVLQLAYGETVQPAT